VIERQNNNPGPNIPYIRGKILGGTTSLNYMIHNTGPKDDWEFYAKFTGDKGWSWDAMQKYFKRSERMVPPTDGRDTTGEWDTSARGKDGLISLTLAGHKTPLDDRILAASKEFPKDFPLILDQNTGNPLGLSWAQLRITAKGERESTATSALAHEYMSRPNLHVLVKAHVTKVFKTGTRSGLPIFRGVEFYPGAGAPNVQVKARREVILSAGVINTPHILKHSGIGDEEELSEYGISTLVPLHSVGKNMSDHPLLLNTWLVDSKTTYDSYWPLGSPTREAAMKQWRENHKGPFTNTVTNLIAWTRVPDSDPIMKDDPSTGPHAPHGELIFYNSYFGIKGMPHPDDTFLAIFTVLASPASRGFVKLNSSDPLVRPIIDPKLYDHPFDAPAMAHAVKMADKVATSKAFGGYVRARFNNLFAAAKTQDSLIDYIKRKSIVLFHGCGTAMMSPKGADWGVLDPDLRVKGVIGLRVADASAIPYVPSAHPMGPIQALAERAADLIKEAYPTSEGKHDEL
jgi:choline dehydrogenase-like flavoprotein